MPEAQAPRSTGRRVRCPACGQAALFGPDNPYRPFCGARCKGIDLGDWASESFRVRADTTAPEHLDDGFLSPL